MSLTVTKGTTVNGNPPTGPAITTTAVGDVIIAFLSQGGSGTPSITDNKNSGNYTRIANYPANFMSIWMQTVSVTGATTLSLTTGGGGFSYLSALNITGFLGTPTVDTSFSTSTATGSSTNSLMSVTSNFNNEVLLMNQYQNDYTSALTVSGWTAATTNTGSTQPGFYAIEPTAGTANSWSGTFSPSASWFLLLTGIYDLSSGPPPLPPGSILT